MHEAGEATPSTATHVWARHIRLQCAAAGTGVRNLLQLSHTQVVWGAAPHVSTEHRHCALQATEIPKQQSSPAALLYSKHCTSACQPVPEHGRASTQSVKAPAANAEYSNRCHCWLSLLHMNASSAHLQRYSSSRAWCHGAMVLCSNQALKITLCIPAL